MSRTYFGYKFSEEYLLKKVDAGCPIDTSLEQAFAVVQYMRGLVQRAGVQSYTFRHTLNKEGKCFWIMAVATTDPHDCASEGMTMYPPPREVRKKLQKLVGTSRPMRWRTIN